jgi:hypothetical protein
MDCSGFAALSSHPLVLAIFSPFRRADLGHRKKNMLFAASYGGANVLRQGNL